MTQANKEVLQRIESWPQEDQEELAELAQEIELRRSAVYKLSDEDRKALARSQADVDAGRFASDERIHATLRKARSARS